MKKEEMYDVIGKIDDKYIIDARSNITKKKNSWIKWGAMAACLCLAFVGAFMLQNSLGLQNKEPHLENPTTANNNPTISLDGTIGNGRVEASYDKGYASVEDLLDVTTLIARATPIAIEYESDVAICWVLRVKESNKEGLDVIRLRQLKDEYLLKVGQEVVLALQQDVGEGYYNIPGGGCGLFRVNEKTGAISGQLLESLKEQASSICFSGAIAELTLDDVFDILIELSHL